MTLLNDPSTNNTLLSNNSHKSCFCFLRLPDGFTQLRVLAHLALNDVSLQTLPNDIGKYVSPRPRDLNQFRPAEPEPGLGKLHVRFRIQFPRLASV